MDLQDGIILAVVQGITELLPISSSGHLILTSSWLGIEPELAWLTFLHLATAMALLLGYQGQIRKILNSGDRLKVLRNIVITSIPAVIVGFLLKDVVDELFYNNQFIAYNLIFWGFAMTIAERARESRKIKYTSLSIRDSLIVGLGQALALFPGTSRSGVTTLTGIAVGMEKGEALDYAFIVGLPLMFGAFGLELITDTSEVISQFTFGGALFFAVALSVGYGSILLLEKIKKYKFLTGFGIYRIVMGLIILFPMA